MNSPTSSSALLSGWRYRALIWSIALASLGYLVFALLGGWREVVQAVIQVGFWGVGIALGLSLVNYGLRFLRWQLYLKRMGHTVPWRPSLNIYLAGFALTTTPGKAGEALRSVLLIPRGVPYRHGLAAFISERLSDLTAIIVMTLIGLSSYPKATSLVVIGAIAVVILFIMMSSERFLKLLNERPGNNFFAMYLRHVGEIGWQCRRCNTPSALLPATLLSLTAWAAEAWAFHLILEWTGIEVSTTADAFIYSVSLLAGSLVFMPGGLGGAEAVMVGLLVWSGAGKPEAVAATVLCRLATLWFAVIIGVISLSIHKDQPAPATPQQ